MLIHSSMVTRFSVCYQYGYLFIVKYLLLTPYIILHKWTSWLDALLNSSSSSSTLLIISSASWFQKLLTSVRCHKNILWWLFICFIFRSSEEIFQCFHRYTEGCTSVVMATAQFHMEWLLHDCPLNKTLISYDILHDVSSCILQLGYDFYNGLQVSSDFVSLVCAAEDLHQICLSSKPIPQMALLYMQPSSDMAMMFRQNQCNNGSLSDTLLVNVEGKFKRHKLMDISKFPLSL